MRRITLWGLSTVAALVLLLSYRTSTAGPSAGDVTQVSADTLRGTGATTYPGSVAITKRGPVQVAIAVVDGRLVAVAVLASPTNGDYDIKVNAHALPLLEEQALAAQSADIDTVSGATVTSDGYRESLQAAIDAAKL